MNNFFCIITISYACNYYTKHSYACQHLRTNRRYRALFAKKP